MTAPFKVRLTGSSSGTLDQVIVQIELVDRAISNPCPLPWAWYRGDDIVGVDGTKFTTWVDRSGNNRTLDAWSGSADRHPTIIDSALDGQRGADFRDVADPYYAPADFEWEGDPTDFTGLSVFHVCLPTSGVWGAQDQVRLFGPERRILWTYINQPTGEPIDWYFEGATPDQPRGLAEGPPSPVIVEVHSYTDRLQVFYNATEKLLSREQDLVTIEDSGAGAQEFPVSVTDLWHGGSGRSIVLETIIFSETLSPSCIAQWRSYLAARYPSTG